MYLTAGRSRVLLSKDLDFMVDLNKFNSLLDLKNLDVTQIVRLLGENLNTLIKFSVIIVSLIIAVMIFNGNHAKEKNMLVLMSQAQQKLDSIQARVAAVDNLNVFKTALPQKLNEFEVITMISEYAKSNHINIASLSPAESKDMGLYDSINVNIDATSDNFKDMILFLNNIEKSQAPLRIDTWSGHEVENGKITFSIAISAVFLHTS
jgi:hypothetical protein